MRFPFVSRDHLDSARASATAEHENAQVLRHLLTDVTARYDRLLDSFTKLRLAGAVEPVVLVPPAPRVVDQLETLIAQEAGGDRRKQSVMLKQLRKDRAAHVSDEEIALRILGGGMAVTDGVPA